MNAGPDTRQRLIAAAVDLFGRHGFDGVGARELAKQADAQLSAIPYHFGTKEALYRAALDQVRQHLSAAIGPEVEAAMRTASDTPAEARNALARLQTALFHAIAVQPQAEVWAKLLIREHLDPSIGFDLVTQDPAAEAVDLMATLIAKATGRDAQVPAVRLEAFAMIGEILAFRILHHTVLRKMGWQKLGQDESAAISAVLNDRLARVIP
jgi:TetR/AcrR family transcriptional regulator, regulator of cefoperazone and chloramphenicol sensitivity